jgi:WD40 repeat protein
MTAVDTDQVLVTAEASFGVWNSRTGDFKKGPDVDPLARVSYDPRARSLIVGDATRLFSIRADTLEVNWKREPSDWDCELPTSHSVLGGRLAVACQDEDRVKVKILSTLDARNEIELDIGKYLHAVKDRTSVDIHLLSPDRLLLVLGANFDRILEDERVSVFLLDIKSGQNLLEASLLPEFHHLFRVVRTRNEAHAYLVEDTPSASDLRQGRSSRVTKLDIRDGSIIWDKELPIQDIAFSDVGSMMAGISISGLRLEVYDLDQTTSVGSLALTGAAPAQSMAISPDAKLFAVGFADGKIDVLGTNKLDTLTSFHASQGNAYSLMFSLDGRTILSTGAGNEAAVFAFRIPRDASELLEIADAIQSPSEAEAILARSLVRDGVLAQAP